jgi:hypothetical protein
MTDSNNSITWIFADGWKTFKNVLGKLSIHILEGRRRYVFWGTWTLRLFRLGDLKKSSRVFPRDIGTAFSLFLMKPYISCLPTLLPTYLPMKPLPPHHSFITVWESRKVEPRPRQAFIKEDKILWLNNWICQKRRRDNVWNAHIQSFRLSRRMRICFHLLLFLLSAKPISVQWNDHKAMHVALGGTVSKTKRNVTIHRLINIVTTIN